MVILSKVPPLLCSSFFRGMTNFWFLCTLFDQTCSLASHVLLSRQISSIGNNSATHQGGDAFSHRDTYTHSKKSRFVTGVLLPKKKSRNRGEPSEKRLKDVFG